ncbi:hypothetical protein ACKKBG_A30740 [Auxenochlorella protothecoides x Auxenochlorella symbiontica]
MRPSRSGHGLRIFLALGFLLHRSAHAEIGGFKGPDPEVLDFCNATEDDQAVRVEAESDFHGPLMIAEISNATIGYFRFGDQTTGRPPLLVFAPFGYTMGDMPRPAMRSLAAHQEVILFDHRGQGFSTDYSNDSPSIVSMANDAMELVEALHLSTKPNVLSFSLGSCVALAVAVLHGPSFASFVIASGSAGSPNSPPATAWAQSVLLDPEARPLEQLAIVYPLQYQSVPVGDQGMGRPPRREEQPPADGRRGGCRHARRLPEARRSKGCESLVHRFQGGGAHSGPPVPRGGLCHHGTISHF